MAVGDHGCGVHDGFEVEEGFEECFCGVWGAVEEDAGHERGLADWGRGDGEGENAGGLAVACFGGAFGKGEDGGDVVWGEG